MKLTVIFLIKAFSFLVQTVSPFGFKWHSVDFRISELDFKLIPATKSKVFAALASAAVAFQAPIPAPQLALYVTAIETSEDLNLKSELETYEEEFESLMLREQREPKNLMESLRKSLTSQGKEKRSGMQKSMEKELAIAREKILTLKAYLDEAERDLFKKDWGNLQVYIYTFAEQEDAFVTLIENLFPSNDELDKSARDALSFEARSMFLALDELREAAKDARFKAAQLAYTKLLLSYDRFLKAGDLYPTYDAITSTEVFFKDADRKTLRFDRLSKVQVLDSVVLKEGPDMGKSGTVIMIDGPYAVVKLDKDGKAYQEVKYIKLDILAKSMDDYSYDKDSKKISSKSLTEDSKRNKKSNVRL